MRWGSAALAATLGAGCGQPGPATDTDTSTSTSSPETRAAPTVADADQSTADTADSTTAADTTPPDTGQDAVDGSTEAQTGALPPADACTGFPPVGDFAEPGPFATVRVAEGPDCTIFRPGTIGDNGLVHPVILWGNGTTASVNIYHRALEHWASHGFIVAAANTSNAGSGDEMMACLNWLRDQQSVKDGPYAGTVDLGHVGASGHSQGGGGALMVGQDSRIFVTAPLQPYTQTALGHDQSSHQNQHGPMFLMSGENDLIATPQPNQQRVFDDTNVPTFWGTLRGANHTISAIGNISGYRGPSTAWFRHHLMCDHSAGALFYEPCTLCSNRGWIVRTANW